MNRLEQCPTSDFGAVHRAPAEFSAMQLEDVFGNVDVENIDFHDEPPDVVC